MSTPAWPGLAGVPARRRPLVLGHRGTIGLGVRENTMEAYRRALDDGADGFELDVRRSADGELVVLHDPVVPGGPEVRLTEASALPSWLPRLGDVLDAFPDALIDIEVKDLPRERGSSRAFAEGTAEAVARLLSNRDTTRVIVTSFSPRILRAVRVHGGDELTLGLLLGGLMPGGWSVGVAGRLGASALLPRGAALGATLRRRAVDAGLAIVAWSADGAEAARSLAAAGVVGLIVDDPAATLRSLTDGSDEDDLTAPPGGVIEGGAAPPGA